MRKIMTGALIAFAMLAPSMLAPIMLVPSAEAQLPTVPGEPSVTEGTNGKLWFRMRAMKERAEIFTNWERMHPHSIFAGAETPRVYKRNTHSIDEVTYQFDGQTHKLTDYIEKADISGLMVLRN